MSRMEIPLSLLDRVLGPRPMPLGVDDAMLRRLERAVRRIEPDPLFKRRLRGHVVNGYVAMREGLVEEPARPRRMGSLGRAVLYASLALAMSVSAVGAASQDSLPGDALYGLKLQLEEVRMQIAPQSVRVELAEIALAERVEELERLAASGSWTLVSAAAARVSEAEELLAELDPTAARPGSAPAARARQALEKVMAKAPAQARPGLERAIEAVGPPLLQPDRLPPGHPLHPTHKPPKASGTGPVGHGSGPGAGVEPDRPPQRPSPSPSPSPEEEANQDPVTTDTRQKGQRASAASSPEDD